MFPNWIIGVLFASVASIISNLGLNLQKLTHLKLKEKNHELHLNIDKSTHSHSHHHASYTDPSIYTSQHLWRIGLLLIILGSVFDFVALTFAAQSIVAPLGSLTLVSNTFFAPLLLKESLSKHDIFSTVIIIIGTSLCVLFADHREINYELEKIFKFFYSLRFLIYAIGIIVSIYILQVIIIRSRKIKHSNRIEYKKEWISYHRFSYAASAGLIGAQSVLFAKCFGLLVVASFVRNHRGILLEYWQTYFIIAGLIITIFLQIKWLNEGLQRFPALYIVPVFQSFWILTSVIGGMLFFQEYKDVFNNKGSSFGFPIGVIVTVVGVYQLSQRKSDAKSIKYQSNSEITDINETDEAKVPEKDFNTDEESLILSAPSSSPDSFGSTETGSILTPLFPYHSHTHTTPKKSSRTLRLPTESTQLILGDDFDTSFSNPTSDDDNSNPNSRRNSILRSKPLTTPRAIPIHWYPSYLALSHSWSDNNIKFKNNMGSTSNSNSTANNIPSNYSSTSNSNTNPLRIDSNSNNSISSSSSLPSIVTHSNNITTTTAKNNANNPNK